MSIEYLHGNCLDVLKTLEDKSVNMCVTSPPYWGLRDYGVEGQLGLEKTPKEYVDKLVEIFREVRRVLKDDGTLWLNLGDSYIGGGRGGKNGDDVGTNTISSRAYEGGTRWGPPTEKVDGYKPKDLVGIPWLAAFGLRDDGWYLRSDIIWHKGSCMPESVKDRPTKSHEYIFLLSKNKKYYYDYEAIKEPAKYTERWGVHNKIYHENQRESLDSNNDDFKNKRSVWKVNPKPFKEAHFAVYPEELITPCIKAGCPEGGVVLDPFGGSGTTALVCQKLKRNCVLIEINKEYIDIQKNRTEQPFLWEM